MTMWIQKQKKRKNILGFGSNSSINHYSNYGITIQALFWHCPKNPVT